MKGSREKHHGRKLVNKSTKDENESTDQEGEKRKMEKK